MDPNLEKYDYFLIDLWGVVWDGKAVFPDAVAFIQNLMDAGKCVRFLSNCAEYVAEELVDRLARAGFPSPSTEWLITSGQAMALWFQEQGLQGRQVYVFGGDAVRENIRRAGAEPIDMPEDGESLADGAVSDCLVVGGMHNFDWQRMTEIVTGVAIGRLRVVLPNPDTVVFQQTGRVRLPPGMIVKIIETALPECQIDRIGKPYPFIYEYALRQIGAADRRDKVLMIGDQLETDVRGASKVGIDSLLLRQGVLMNTSMEEILARAADRGIYPDYFVQRLALDEPIQSVDWRNAHGSQG